MTTLDHIRRRLLQQAGIPTWDGKLDDIKRRIMSRLIPFVVLMYNRLVLGHMRYGPLDGQRQGKPIHDHAESIRARLDLWEQDGNDEHLVDIANLAFCEYIEGCHPKKHFSAADDSTHVKPTS